MADVHSKKQRSKNMSAIKGRGNKSTEIALIKIFRSSKITGWRRNNKSLPGKPDFVFPKFKKIIFVDGCFWHGCLKCNLRPASNKEFWDNKLNLNKVRDRRKKRDLINEGWMVLRIWEHQLKKNPERTLLKILAFLED